MVKTRMIRVGTRFIVLRNNFKRDFGVSDSEFTNGISDFLEKENLVPIMYRRLKKKGRGGLFD